MNRALSAVANRLLFDAYIGIKYATIVTVTFVVMEWLFGSAPTDYYLVWCAAFSGAASAASQFSRLD